MKLATFRGDGPDGRLVVVSRDGRRWRRADPVARTLQEALDNWTDVLGPLKQISASLDAGNGETRVCWRPPCRALGNGWMDRHFRPTVR